MKKGGTDESAHGKDRCTVVVREDAEEVNEEMGEEERVEGEGRKGETALRLRITKMRMSFSLQWTWNSM